MTRAVIRPVVGLALALAVACGEPARVGGLTLDEQLARIDGAPADLRGALVRSLGEFGAAGDPAVARLEAWLRGDGTLRDDAGRALAGIATVGAQDALLRVIRDPDADLAVLEPAAIAAAACVSADRWDTAVRALVKEAPRRAARLLVTDRAYDAALGDPVLRAEVVVGVADALDRLDPRGQSAALRRLVDLGGAGREDLLARALARGVAVDAALDALVACRTPQAFAVVEARLGADPPAPVEPLLVALGRLAAAVPAERTLAVLDRFATATGATVAEARVRALDAVARGRRDAAGAVTERLAAALAHDSATVARAAFDIWAALARDGAVDPTRTVDAWRDLAIADADLDRGRRLVAGLAAAGLPGAPTVAALAEVGLRAALPVAAAAERGLERFDTAPALAARVSILARPELPDAARRAAALARAIDEASVADMLGALARSRPAPAFAAALLDEVDRRGQVDPAAAARRLALLERTLRAEEVATDVRLGAARRLLADDPARARIDLRLDGTTVTARLLVDRTLRATDPGALDEAEAGLYVLPRDGRITVPRTTGSRRVVLWLDAALRPIGRAVVGPDPAVAALARAAIVLPPAMPADAVAAAPIADPRLLLPLAR